MPNRFAGLMVHSVLAIAMLGCSSASEDGETGVLEDSLGRALSPLSREIVAANPEESVGLPLLARVEIQESELVEFYELPNGMVLLSAAGAPASRHPALANFGSGELDHAELWETITDGAAVPELLATALKRARPRTQLKPTQETFGESVPEPAGDSDFARQHVAPGIGELKQAHLYSGWCDSGYYTQGYGNCSGSWDFSRCWDHVTGYGSAWHNDCGHEYTNVCPYLGNVVLEVKADESGVSTGMWTVLENTGREQWYVDWECDLWFNDCPYIKSAVHDTTNDQYQFRFFVDVW